MIDTDTLIAGTSISPLIVLIVQIIKENTPAEWWAVKARTVLLTLAVGPVLVLGAWALGYLPAWTTWRDAVRTGLTASLQAAGLYSSIKATLPAVRKRVAGKTS